MVDLTTLSSDGRVQTPEGLQQPVLDRLRRGHLVTCLLCAAPAL